MKTIKFKFLFIAFAMIITMVSCSKDFLDVQPKGTNLESNYYKNDTEALAGLVAVYDLMRKNSGGFENMITMMNAGSDDNYAGGGGATDGAGIQGFSNYTLNPTSMPRSFWSDHYQGIYRANYLLTKLPGIPMDASLIARYTAESKALRANYY
jgi:starch-binding outer membrane protein, SusD/RagB family